MFEDFDNLLKASRRIVSGYQRTFLGKYELQAVLANCKQGGDSVAVYCSKLKKIWEELKNYQQLPSCDCGRQYANSTVITTNSEEEKIYQF